MSVLSRSTTSARISSPLGGSRASNPRMRDQARTSCFAADDTETRAAASGLGILRGFDLDRSRSPRTEVAANVLLRKRSQPPFDPFLGSDVRSTANTHE